MIATKETNANVDEQPGIPGAFVESALVQLQLWLNSAEEQLTELRSNLVTTICKANTGVNLETATQLHVLQSQHKLDQSRLHALADKLEKILSCYKESAEGLATSMQNRKRGS